MRLIDADALLEHLKDYEFSHLLENIYDEITNAPTVQGDVLLTSSKYKTVMQCLNKISEFCPVDENVNKLDESQENLIRLSFAEIGDTARCAIETLIEIESTVHREGKHIDSNKVRATVIEHLPKSATQEQIIDEVIYTIKAIIAAAPKE